MVMPFVVGNSFNVYTPQLKGEWLGMRILNPLDPCLPTTVVDLPFTPPPFPDQVSNRSYVNKNNNII